MQVEKMIGWVRNDCERGGDWITPLGEYRKQAEADDMLAWLTGPCDLNVKTEIRRQSKFGGPIVLVFIDRGPLRATFRGSTLKESLLAAVNEIFYTKRKVAT